MRDRTERRRRRRSHRARDVQKRAKESPLSFFFFFHCSNSTSFSLSHFHHFFPICVFLLAPVTSEPRVTPTPPASRRTPRRSFESPMQLAMRAQEEGEKRERREQQVLAYLIHSNFPSLGSDRPCAQASSLDRPPPERRRNMDIFRNETERRRTDGRTERTSRSLRPAKLSQLAASPAGPSCRQQQHLSLIEKKGREKGAHFRAFSSPLLSFLIFLSLSLFSCRQTHGGRGSRRDIKTE